jgi:hypothetical protein
MLEHPATPPPPPNTDLHDRLVDEVEEKQPDGPSPKGQSSRTAARLLFAFGAVALGGMVILLFIRGGWPTGLAGLGILFLYAFMGSTPWFAGVLRARDRREAETIVNHELGIDQTPGRPA